MFDTHCHLNSSRFASSLDEVMKRAHDAGINYVVIPGTDVETSKKAVEIANRFPHVYVGVGIHPHHVFQFQTQKSKLKSQNYKSKLKSELKTIEKLLQNKRVVAVGEVGMDRYYYKKTKYQNYQVTNEFIKLQKEVLRQQIELALGYKKSLILHNREAVSDLLEVLREFGSLRGFEGRAVFHCCEPEEALLDFAKEKKIFIGVDGDVTYDKKKQDFIKNVPLEMLVLETDSPFLTPEPLKSNPALREGLGPNEPQHLSVIVEFLSDMLSVSKNELIKKTTKNAKRLFGLS